MRLPLLTETSAIDEVTAQRSGLLRQFNIDLPLLLGLLLACILGLIVLYSASQANLPMVSRQSIHMLIGLVCMVAVAQVPPHQLRVWTPWVFAITLLLLGAVLLTGVIGKGAQRWLDLGIIRFQPSELAKIAVPMMLAWYYADKPLPLQPRYALLGVLITVVPVVMIVQQPDLGTALLVALSGAFALFLAGLSWLIIGGLLLLVAVLAPLFWMFIMHDYQRQRVLTFLDPESDPLGAGWNIIQSKIAIGSGGLYGKGWLNGSQAHLSFLPEGSTDFIFAVYAEEFGLMGLALLLGLYFFIIARSLYLASQGPDTYTRLLGGSLALIFFIYVFVNAGMVCGLLPVVGLPLPLISYGGTAIVTIMVGFGILMGVYSHRRLLIR